MSRYKMTWSRSIMVNLNDLMESDGMRQGADAT